MDGPNINTSSTQSGATSIGNILKIFGLTATVAIGVLSYLLYNANAKAEKTLADYDKKIGEITEIQYRLDSVSTQLDAKMAEIKNLGGTVDGLEKTRLHLMKDLSLLKNTQDFDKESFDQRIEEYKAILNEKDQLIAQLRAENETLQKEKGALIQEKESIFKENNDLKAERSVLASSMNEVTSKNDELRKKIHTASRLRANNISISAINQRGKILEGGSFKAKNVEQLLISFNLAPNAAAEQNTKEVYVKISAPDGIVLSNGTGVFQYDGKDLPFSIRKVVDYTSNDQKVEAIYSSRGEFSYLSGNYIVEIFAEGFKIGESSFSIR